MEQDRNNPISDELLVGYLYNEATAEERQQVETWLAVSAANRLYLSQLAFLKRQSSGLPQPPAVDVDAEWHQLQQRLRETEAEPDPLPVRRRSSSFRITAIAAAIALLIAVPALLWWQQSSSPVILSSGNRVLSDTLPDGSIITLNKYSSIRYSSNYRHNRELTLEGEAFFKVQHDAAHPFTVNAGKVRVRVLGTSFNVATNDDSTEVIVETGKVAMSRNGYTIDLHPGQKGLALGDTAAPVKLGQADLLYSYYRTHNFICKGTPLYQLVAVLGKAFDREIIIEDPEKRTLELTTAFVDQSLDEILAIVCTVFELHVETQGRRIILK